MNPSVSLSLSMPYPFMNDSDLLANGDINGDGCDDICVPYNDSLYVFWGNESMIIDSSTFYIENSQPQPVHANAFYCNINNDEYDDLGIRMWGENHVDFYLGGDNFQTQPAYSIGIAPCLSSAGIGVDLGDLNGDQHDDVLVSDGGNFNSATVYSLNPVANDDPVLLPGDCIKNYPNPFNPSTTITYQIPASGSVRLEIFNIKGQKVRTLVNDLQNAGSHSVVWNGTDQSGRLVSSGIYFYHIVTDRSTSTRKMLLLK